MKATKLLELIKEAIDKYGENLEVFIEAPAFNAEEIFSTKESSTRVDYIQIDDLLNFPNKELIVESWGINKGIIYGFTITGDESLYING